MEKVEAASCRFADWPSNKRHGCKAPSPVHKRLERHSIELRRWGVVQRWRAMARADAARCRVYGERILRATNIDTRNTGKRARKNCAQMINYERISGNLNGSASGRGEQVWRGPTETRCTNETPVQASCCYRLRPFSSLFGRRPPLLPLRRGEMVRAASRESCAMIKYGGNPGNSRCSARSRGEQVG